MSSALFYYESYVVVQPGETGLQVNDLLTEEQYLDIMASLPPTNAELDEEDPKKFIALIGGEAVKELLKRIDVEALAEILRERSRHRDFTTEEGRSVEASSCCERFPQTARQ